MCGEGGLRGKPSRLIHRSKTLRASHWNSGHDATVPIYTAWIRRHTRTLVGACCALDVKRIA